MDPAVERAVRAIVEDTVDDQLYTDHAQALLDSHDHHSKRADAAEAEAEALEAVCEDEEAAHGETVDLATRRGQGLRARTVAAESLRDAYRSKLIEVMGVEAFEAWDEIPF